MSMKSCGAGAAGRSAALVTLLAAALSSSPALADDGDKAKEHFLKGKALVEEGAHDKAIIEFEASYKLKPVPIVLYNIGICYDELHRYADAAKYYTLYLAGAEDVSKELKAQVEARIKKIKQFIGSLNLVVTEEGAEIIVDGKLVGLTPFEVIFLETGEHDLLLRRTGLPDFTKKFTIVSGETTKIVVPAAGGEEPSPALAEAETEKPEAAKPEAGKPQVEKVKAKEPEARKERKKIGKAPFAVMAAAAGATLVAAIVTGSLALSAEKDFHEQYYEQEDEWRPLKDRADTLAATTDALIGIGSAAAAAAIILAVFTDFKAEKEPAVTASPVIGPDAAGVVIDVSF